MQTDEFWRSFIVEASGALIGAGIGALLAMMFAQALQSAQERRALTQRLIDEFLGPELLRHRIVGADVRRLLQAGEVDVDDLAAGFWYPGRDNYYVGPVSEGFNQHQHVEVLKSWAMRASSAIRLGRARRALLRESLQDSYRWLDALLTPLSEATLRQISAAKRTDANVRDQRWTDDVRYLRKFFRLETSVARTAKFRRDELEGSAIR